jgi:hypothetical protein
VYWPKSPGILVRKPCWTRLAAHAEAVSRYADEAGLAEPAARLMDQLGLYWLARGFSEEQIYRFRQTYGGRMAEKEVEFLHSLQHFIDDAIREGLGFVPVAQSLRQNIRGIFHHPVDVDNALRFNLDAAVAAGEVAVPNPDQLKVLRQVNGEPMSEREVEFLRDIQGIIDYAIRNDLGLSLVVGMLNHDLSGLEQYGFSVDNADADCFSPKVSGFAGRPRSHRVFPSRNPSPRG